MEYTIRRAVPGDAEKINSVTKKAFVVYRDELHSSANVYALSETIDMVISDIINNNVYVAVSRDNEIYGSIRYNALNSKLAYIYRFGVDPAITSTGIGTDLLTCVIEKCEQEGFSAIALHTNSKYYKLARYYYGKNFFVHSTSTEKGYIRALFIKELSDEAYDISPAFLL